jgi:cation:H+ antiporter
MLIINLIFFALAAIVVMISSTILIKTLNKIAEFLHISRFTAAFIIMAFATAIPELFVGISSAISGASSISLGNLLGSSILHFTLLVGIFILFGEGIKVRNGKIGKDIYFVLISIVLLIGLGAIGREISRIDGAILLIFFSASYYRIFKKSKKYPAKFKHKKTKKYEIISYPIIFIIAIGILFVASKYIVEFASLIAIDLHFPEIIIGLFLISFATTLPEFIFGLKAVKMGYKELALGDLTGGVLTNIGFVLGIVALIRPIAIDITPFIISSVFLFISAFIFVTFMKSDKELKESEGIALILLYVFFMAIQIFMR